MPYYTKVLQPGETVRYLGRLHWIIYGRTIFGIFLAAVFAVVALNVNDPAQPWLQIVFAAGAVIFLLAAILSGVGAFIRRRTTEIVVTDRRVLFKNGLVSRHTLEMNTTKIETVDVDQSIVARMLGYGTVSVRGTGSGMEPMRQVAEPLELRNSISILVG